MKRDFRDYLDDILNSMKEVDEFTKDLTAEKFMGDRKTVNAVIRSLEVIGEAAKKIPEKIRKKYPGIPWKNISGMRDKLIHEYHGVDLETVWVVIKEELPPLKPHIEKMIEEMEKGG